MSIILFLLLAALPLWAREIPFGEKNALFTKDFIYGGSSRQATAKVWRDDTHLNVSLIAEHPGVDKRSAQHTEHDQEVYQDDTLEVFLDTDGRQRAFYQIIANVNGAIFDHYRDAQMFSRLEWDSGATATGSYGDGSYQIALKIPLASLNLGENPRNEIGMAVGSYVSQTRDACSAWGEYHKPMTWQRFTLPGEYPVILKSFRASTSSGKQPFAVTLQNISGKAVELAGSFNIEPVALILQPGETRTLQLYATHQAGRATANVLALNAGGREVLRCTRIFTPVQLLTVFPASPLLYPNDPIRIIGRITEQPDMPLEIIVHCGGKSVSEKFTVSRQFTIDLPPQPASEIECRYKDERQSFKLETIHSPWGDK